MKRSTLLSAAALALAGVIASPLTLGATAHAGRQCHSHPGQRGHQLWRLYGVTLGGPGAAST
jgi:hypothetical protein